jgi:cell division protein ZipA
MSELRWILLGVGLALIAGIWLAGVRARRRSAATEPGRAVVFEPPPPSEHLEAPRAESFRVEPSLRSDEPRMEPSVDFDAPMERAEAEPPEVELGEPLTSSRPQGAVRREPTLGQRLTTHYVTPQPFEPEPAGEPAASHDAAFEADDGDESEDAAAARAQRIVAVRVTAPAPSRFEGSLLQESLAAEGFEFGRYQIFHRLDPRGRPVISVASLREPGTFDPATMAGAAYAGVALFAVLPGPLPAQQAFEELLVAGRALAGRLGGNLQDERGGPLSVNRISLLREEMLTFDRDRAGRPGR